MFGFGKKYRYGILRAVEEGKFTFEKENNVEKFEETSLTKVMNTIGNKGWKLKEVDDVVGFIFIK